MPGGSSSTWSTCPTCCTPPPPRAAAPCSIPGVLAALTGHGRPLADGRRVALGRDRPDDRERVLADWNDHPRHRHRARLPCGRTARSCTCGSVCVRRRRAPGLARADRGRDRPGGGNGGAAGDREPVQHADRADPAGHVPGRCEGRRGRVRQPAGRAGAGRVGRGVAGELRGMVRVHPPRRSRGRRRRLPADAGRDDERFDVEYRVVHPDGSVHWVHDQARPVLRADEG